MAAGLIALLVACGCQATSTAPTTEPTARPSASTATTSLAQSPAITGLRGERQSTGTCAASLENGQLPPEGPVVAIDEPVRLYRVCQSAAFPARQSDFVEVTTGQAIFEELSSALAAPDQQATSSVWCPLIGLIPQQVLAETPSGWWSLHIPTDVCHQYQRSIYGLLLSITTPS